MFRDEFIQTELVPVWSLGLTDKTECPICYSEFTDPVKLPCNDNHVYCRECIEHWLNDATRNSCPECRHVLFELTTPEEPQAEPAEEDLEPNDDDNYEEPEFFVFGVSEEGQYAYADMDLEAMYSWNDYRLHDAAGTQVVRVPGEENVPITGQGYINRTEMGGALIAIGNFILDTRARWNPRRPYSVHLQEYWNQLLHWVYQICILENQGRTVDVATMPEQWRARLQQEMPGLYVFFLGSEFVQPQGAWRPYQADFVIVLEFLAYVAFARQRAQDQDAEMGDT